MVPSRGAVPQVVVGGQVPPPVCGQHVCVARLLDELGSDDRVSVHHLDYRFAGTLEDQGRVTLGKLAELLRVVVRVLALGRGGRPAVYVHPVSGPATAGAVKDAVVVLAARLVSRRVVLQFHGGGHARTWSATSWLHRSLMWALGRADAAVVHATMHRTDAELMDIGQVVVVPHRVDDRRDPSLRSPDRRGRTVLYVGHLGPHRGTPELIDAVAALRAAGRDVRLDLVGRPGQGWTDDDLRAALASHPADMVCLRGELTGVDLDRAYADADVFAFPSRHLAESFGLVLVEALMWGLPVVASDWRAAPEVLAGDGLDVRLHDSGDRMLPELQAALEVLLDRFDRGELEVPSPPNRAVYETRYSTAESPLRELLVEYRVS